MPLAAIPSHTMRKVPALSMPTILHWGIYGGVTTPTEAAAALYALLLSGLVYRALTLCALLRIFVESARSSAAVGRGIGSALILNYIVASENSPTTVAAALVGLDIPPRAFLIGVNVLILLLGYLLDATTLILLILLILLTCRALGIDLVHFGVVAIVNCVIGPITPHGAIIREVWPFLAVHVLAFLAMILGPGIVLWLPIRFGYQPLGAL